ncbi:MAG: M56 family metallopeptidase, partial [Gemmatimonadetes bacterium]|nr:M56 family metallopeptidase [Gemmatimonadota bacterium]
MNALIQSVSTSGGDWLPFLLDTSLKAVVVLLLAVVITAGLRSASASVRHHVWTLAFVSIVALPFVSRSLPSWEVAVPGWRAEVGETRSAPTRIEAADPPVVATPRGEVASRSGGVTFARPEIAAATRAGSIEVARSPLDPKAVVLWAWLAGLVVMLSRLAAGVCSAWLTTRRAEPVADARWTGVVQELSDRLGIRATVRVLVSDRIATPMAWGTLRPVLLLPSGAGSWSADRRRAVALHELAHIKRRDCLVHLIAQAGRAIHWFNPLAWVGTKRLRAERERACDDLVLTSGTRSADYARLLLDVARGRADRRLSWATVSMARPTELEGRLLAILDPVRDRRGIGRPAAIAALGLSLGVLLPLAAFQAAPQPPVPRAVEPAVAPDAPPAPEREDRRALPAVVPST